MDVMALVYPLGDVFVGSFPITQGFGENPQLYNAKFGLKGHNGTDFGCPTGTMVLSAADGWVSEVGFDTNGYGNYVKIVHNGYLTLYGHLNDYIVNVGDKMVAGQLLGHSNNTGNSTGPHLHFGVAPCDVNGVKIAPDNGYSGYIDPMGASCDWQIKNLTAPIVPQVAPTPETTTIPVKTTDFTVMNAQGSDYKVIVTFCQANGLNDFLTANHQAPLDIQGINPGDPEGGSKVNMFIADLMSQIHELKTQTPVPTPTSTFAAPQAPMPQSAQTSLLTTIFNTVKGFIWET